MSVIFRIKICVLIALGSYTTRAQDALYGGDFTSASMMNPAFISYNTCKRFTLFNRVQWAGISNGYNTTIAVAEFKAKRGNKGYGFGIVNDLAGSGNYRTSIAYGAYAKSVKTGIHSELLFGLQAGFGQISVNWSKLTFGDMIDARRGVVYATNQTFGEVQTFMNFNSGVAFISKQFFLGVACMNLSKPIQSLIPGSIESHLPRHYNFHGGVVVHGYVSGNRLEFLPQVSLDIQGASHVLTAGSTVSYKQAAMGMWIRINRSAALSMSLIKGNVRFGVTAEVPTNKLLVRSMGTYECFIKKSISCNNSKKHKMLECPLFD